jgi:hypothetical protein
MPVTTYNFTIAGDTTGWEENSTFGNRLSFDTSGAGFARYNGEGTYGCFRRNASNKNHKVTVTLVAGQTFSISGIGAVARSSGSWASAPGRNFLCARAYGAGGVELFKLVGGTETSVAYQNLPSGTWASGDSITLETENNVTDTAVRCRVYRNATQVIPATVGDWVDVTDAVFLTALGFGAGGSMAVGNNDVDTLAVETPVAAGATLTFTSRLANFPFALARGQLVRVVPLAGTNDTAGTTIKYRIVNLATGLAQAGHDWQVLVSNAPVGGFVQYKTLPPGMYRAEVRDNDVTATTVVSGDFGVGWVLALGGQSNMAGLLAATPLQAAHPQTFAWTGSGWGGVSGLGQVELANRLQALAGGPVWLINRAVGGTALSTWQPGQTNHSNQWAWITAATAYEDKTGGDISAWLWCQGEAGEYVQATYEAGLAAINSDLLTRTGKTAADMLFLIAVTGRDTSGSNDANWNAVRRAQVAFADANQSAEISHYTNDLPLADTVHYQSTTLGYGEHGRRFARSTAKAWGAVANDARGPTFTAISYTSPKVTIDFDGNGSTLNTVDAGAAAAWRVTSLDGSTTYALAGDPVLATQTRLELTLAAPPATGTPLLVWHGYGQNPNLTATVRGNLAA